MEIKVLGSGTEGGIPRINCTCENCRAARKNPSKQRLRASIAIKDGKKWVLIDCGPDFRQQLTREGLTTKDVKAIFITHGHFDHVTGLPELWERDLKTVVYGPKQTLAMWFGKRKNFEYLKPSVTLKNVKPGHKVKVGSLTIEPFMVPHFKDSVGYCVTQKGKKICYTSDCGGITSEMVRAFRGSNLVIFDGTFLLFTFHGHMGIAESAPLFHALGLNVNYIHINHTEDLKMIDAFLKQLGFKTLKDRQTLRIN